ncbi:MAG TPA: VTT domain-containing protein [Candidatus Saccharimonadia bacterium]|jgi:uncharacterized membrane protein YdjX (TVP38/TMEM64 family)|nr:VTT domain-containing protein [Candidatus Saccharimonadia bacterium]
MKHKHDNGQQSLAKLIPGLLVLLVITILSMVVVQLVGGVEQMRALVNSAGVWAPLVFLGLKAVTYVVAPLSGAPLTLMAGGVFGLQKGFILIVAGEMLGACLNFWIARQLGRPAIRWFGGDRTIRRVDGAVQHVGGWRALLVSSVLLYPIYDFISYAAGLSVIGFGTFFVISLAGIVPWSVMWVFLGERIVTMFTYQWLLIGLGLIVLIGLGWWLRPRRR